MADTSKIYCSILFDILIQKGVKDVVCSPGSRNLPLLMAVSNRDFFKKHFVLDEREAAFVGLGLAMVKQQPVALICTSGSALLNYSPAVAEAYYQGVPLIVISADRPLQWIDQDDSQTIRQNGVLNNFVKGSFTIPAIGEENTEMQWYVTRIVNEAIHKACEGKPGPVHINIHLDEPLNEVSSKNTVIPKNIISVQGDAIPNKEYIKFLSQKLAESRILLIAGFNFPDSFLQKSIAEFSRFENVAVMAETISNLHLSQNDYAIDSVLTAYNQDILEEFSPDIVLSFGGALVSRKLKEYLRKNSSRCEHWSIGYSNTFSDPFMSLTMRIEVEPARFFKQISAALRKLKIGEDTKNYKKNWEDLRIKASALKNNFIRESGWSELKAFDIILNNIPGNLNLFLSNGTPIRYAQIINYALPHGSYCNRGVSGIDGSTATSIGAAKAFKGNTLLITGDLSLAYDIGALSLKEIPYNFKIIVIDNQGGGIFRFIPSTKSFTCREEYLCQEPILPLVELSKGYDWDYFEAENETELVKVLKPFFTSKNKAILRVKCPGIESADILSDYMVLKV